LEENWRRSALPMFVKMVEEEVEVWLQNASWEHVDRSFLVEISLLFQTSTLYIKRRIDIVFNETFSS